MGSIIERFDKLISCKYNDMRKKYKQFCFLNKLTYSDDVFNTTYLKVKERLMKGGELKDSSDKGLENYFFLAFKRNIFLEHKKESKFSSLESIGNEAEGIAEEDSDNERNNLYSYILLNILDKISSEFDSISVRCWRIKRLITVDGKFLTYEDIRRMTHILDAKKRIVTIDKWIKNNKEIASLIDNVY